MTRPTRILADVWMLLWVAAFVILAVRLGGWGLLLWAFDWVLLTLSWFGDKIAPLAERLASNKTAVVLLRALGLPGIILFFPGIIFFPLFNPPDIPLLGVIVFWVGHGWIVGGSSNLVGGWLLGRMLSGKAN